MVFYSLSFLHYNTVPHILANLSLFRWNCILFKDYSKCAGFSKRMIFSWLSHCHGTLWVWNGRGGYLTRYFSPCISPIYHLYIHCLLYVRQVLSIEWQEVPICNFDLELLFSLCSRKWLRLSDSRHKVTKYLQPYHLILRLVFLREIIEGLWKKLNKRRKQGK